MDGDFNSAGVDPHADTEPIIASIDIGKWLISKNHLLAAYELLFELEDTRDAADPTEPQARDHLRDFFNDKSRFPPQELAAVRGQDGALQLASYYLTHTII